MCIDYNSPIPLYVQLKEVLKDKILKGDYKEKIPSERDFMEQFSVSRSTVRKAINALVLDGVLERIHGRGTFVSLRPVEEWLGNLSTFNDLVCNMGMKPSIKLLYQGVESATENSVPLGLTEVYVIKRLRFADDVPLAVERQYYPLKIGLKLAQFDLNNAAIYDLLESSLGINLSEAEEVITGRMSTKEEAKLLGSDQLISVLQTERIIFDTDGNPVEYERSVYRSDMYSFRIKLARKRG
ncbi:GntR family transcriptional regulator [Desulforamulus ruminis]